VLFQTDESPWLTHKPVPVFLEMMNSTFRGFATVLPLRTVGSPSQAFPLPFLCHLAPLVWERSAFVLNVKIEPVLLWPFLSGVRFPLFNIVVAIANFLYYSLLIVCCAAVRKRDGALSG
jgi:hypothetical protein